MERKKDTRRWAILRHNEGEGWTVWREGIKARHVKGMLDLGRRCGFTVSAILLDRCILSGEEHDLPDHPFDWAVPIGWLYERQARVYKKDPAVHAGGCGGHIVWSYGPDDGLFGRPLALCKQGRKWLALSEED